jgi:hypothetical protein
MPKCSNYDQKAMEIALQEMQSNGNSLRVVARKYGVPPSSLQFKRKNSGHKKTCDSSSVLSNEEENTLV